MAVLRPAGACRPGALLMLGPGVSKIPCSSICWGFVLAWRPRWPLKAPVGTRSYLGLLVRTLEVCGGWPPRLPPVQHATLIWRGGGPLGAFGGPASALAFRACSLAARPAPPRPRGPGSRPQPAGDFAGVTTAAQHNLLRAGWPSGFRAVGLFACRSSCARSEPRPTAVGGRRAYRRRPLPSSLARPRVRGTPGSRR